MKKELLPVFDNQVEEPVKTKSVPVPNKITDIDQDDMIYDDIIFVEQESPGQLNTLEGFTSVSMTRDVLYDRLDEMCSDSRISRALDIYASSASEPNENGRIVWAEGTDAKCTRMVDHILENIRVDKYAYEWIYSLIKYGDTYLKLYRESEIKYSKERRKKAQLNENVVVKAYEPTDKYSNYVSMHKNPAELFELKMYGKTAGFIKTNMYNWSKKDNSLLHRYALHENDIEIFPADSFVHAYLPDTDFRHSEEVELTINSKPEDRIIYDVVRGKSLLYDTYLAWKNLSLLENAIKLNRMTRSSSVKIIMVETGDMSKTSARRVLTQVKQEMATKSALDINNNYTEYRQGLPSDTMMFINTKDGKGTISSTDIGSDKSMQDDLNDLNYFNDVFFGALGIPKQYLGILDDNAGFSGGESLSIINSEFAKRVKRIQNALIQALSNYVDLVLHDKGLMQYVGEFTLKMQSPTTQEERDRRDNLNAAIDTISNVLNIIQAAGVEDPKVNIRVVTTMLADTGVNAEVINILQQEIDIKEYIEEEQLRGEENDYDFDSDFSGPEDFDNEIDMGPDDLGIEDTTVVEPEPAEESFQDNTGQEVLMETQDEDKLPSFNDLGISFEEV